MTHALDPVLSISGHLLSSSLAEGTIQFNRLECGQYRSFVLQELVALHLLVRSGHGGGVPAARKNITLVEATCGPGGGRHYFSFPEDA
jgi:hypothetical protein